MRVLSNKLIMSGSPLGPCFWCPGCNTLHNVAGWAWNENVDKPTFSPSVLTNAPLRCHSFVIDGEIHFLDDTEHQYKGQIIPLPDMPDWILESAKEG